VSKETARQWMLRTKLWRGKKAQVKQVRDRHPRESLSRTCLTLEMAYNGNVLGRTKLVPAIN